MGTISKNMKSTFYSDPLPNMNIYCSGRNSDGHNWVDYLTQSSGIEIRNQSITGATLSLNKLNNFKQMKFEQFLTLDTFNRIINNTLMLQYDMFESDLNDHKIEINTEDIVVLSIGFNDMIRINDYKMKDLITNQELFIESMLEVGVKHLVLCTIQPLELYPIYKLNLGYESNFFNKVSSNLLVDINQFNNNLKNIQNKQSFYQSNLNKIKSEIDIKIIENKNLFNSVLNQFEIHFKTNPCYQGEIISNQTLHSHFKIRNEMEEFNQMQQLNLDRKMKDRGAFDSQHQNTACEDKYISKYAFYDIVSPSSEFNQWYAREIAGMFNQFQGWDIDISKMKVQRCARLKLNNKNLELVVKSFKHIFQDQIRFKSRESK